jgi:hypothetical protein
MPIRTHRGRAAVYRRLWGWPLRSPKHLVFAVVLFAVAATVIGLLLPEPPPTPRAEADRYTEQPPPPSASPQTSHASPPSFLVPMGAPPAAAPNPDGLAAAEAWGKQWVNHPPGTNKQQWMERLRLYTSDEFITVMDSIDPANVPATAVTGPPRAVESTASSMEVRLPTNAGDVQVRVSSTPHGWRVAGYDKV